jgi:hypothetical protein
MSCVAQTANAFKPSHKEILLKGNEAVIDAKKILITGVHEYRFEGGMEYTAIKAKMLFDDKEEMLYVRYMFLRQ